MSGHGGIPGEKAGVDDRDGGRARRSRQGSRRKRARTDGNTRRGRRWRQEQPDWPGRASNGQEES